MRHFHEQLDDLFQRLVLMGSLTEGMIRTAVRALTDQNEALTTEVYAREQEVNALQVEVDDKCVRLTSLQQPVAQDALVQGIERPPQTGLFECEFEIER